MSDDLSLGPADSATVYVVQNRNDLHQLEDYVMLTAMLYPTLFVLCYLKSRIAGNLLRPLSKGVYMLVLVLVPYVLGLMGKSVGSFKIFTVFYGVYAVFLLFAYSGLDNLTAVNLEMRYDRPSILFRFSMQFVLMILFLYTTIMVNTIVAVAVAFFIICIKLAERTGALAHAAGVTSGLRDNIRRVVGYMNEEQDDDGADPVSMKGFKYLIGPRCSTVKDDKITDGVSLENIWGCKGSLLSPAGDPDGQFKDTCLSFAFFWMLLAKFWGYRLYTKESKKNALKLVRDGLLAGGDYKRAFRVIEVELCFFHDYFYSKYFFFYLNGFYWKAITLLFPVGYWWTIKRYFDYDYHNKEYNDTYGIEFNFTPVPTRVVTTVILVLEAIQFVMFITSAWLRVALLSYYAKREMSNKRWPLLSWCINHIIGAICRISLSTNTSILYKSWKRELDQYSLLRSCTSFGIEKKSLLQSILSAVGISVFRPPGRKLDAIVPLSDKVKKAVVQSLQTMNVPELTNGSASLKRNGVDKGLMWACELKRDAEVILVWHVATFLFETHPDSLSDSIKSLDDFKVATTLSKYCAYLLAFAPSLVSVPLLEAEFICDKAVTEARKLVTEARKLYETSPFFVCGKAGEIKHESVIDMLTADKEAGVVDIDDKLLQKGLKLYQILHQSALGVDQGKIWKILAEFWAEMVLFLAQPNHNETFHAERLAEGGEFITHLWALLVHAGIEERYG